MASLICAGCHLFSGFRPGKSKKCNLSLLAVPATKGKNAILSVLRCHFICAAMPFYLCCDTILIGLADAIRQFWSQCPRFHVDAKSSMPFYLCCDAILSVLGIWLGFRAQALEIKTCNVICACTDAILPVLKSLPDARKAKMQFICASTDAILSVLPMPFISAATVIALIAMIV